MVSRADRPAHPAQERSEAPASIAGRLLLAWRRTVTSSGRTGASAFRVVTALRDPAGAVNAASHVTLRTFRLSGVSALLLGVVGATVVGLSDDVGMVTVVITATGTVVWAFVRLLVLRAMAPNQVRHPALLGGVWGLGLVPYLFGLTSLLRSVSFVASVWITYRGARGAGTTPRAAGLMVGTAFGSQIVVALAAWVMRGGTLLFLGLATG